MEIFYMFSYLMRHQAQYWQMMLGVNLVLMYRRKITNPSQLLFFYIILGISSMGVNISIRLMFGRTEEVLSSETDLRPTCWAIYKSEAYTDLIYGFMYLFI